MRLLAKLIALVASMGAAVLYLVTPVTPVEDLLINIPESDQRMQSAINDARQTLPEFLAAMTGGAKYCAVKAPITDSNGTEHFWLTVVKHENRTFTGRIDNRPETVRCVSEGQLYSLPEGDISDWIYIKDGVAVGNRTLRVLLDYMSPADAAKAKRAMGWN